MPFGSILLENLEKNDQTRFKFICIVLRNMSTVPRSKA